MNLAGHRDRRLSQHYFEPWSMDYPCGLPLIFEDEFLPGVKTNFRNLNDRKLCLSVYTIKIKGSSFYTLAQIFPEIHTWV